MVDVVGKNRWQNLYNHLKSKGFDVFPPGIKIGECKKNYVVITFNGSNRSPLISSDMDLYSVMCFVPRYNYSVLETMLMDVKNAMKEIRPMFIPYGTQSPSFYDDGYKAHMVSIDYVNYKKI